MKKHFFILLLFPLFLSAQSRKQKNAQKKADKETLSHLKAHIQYLANDKLEGRRTGTAGELLAMQYIANQFLQTGLQPKGSNGFIQAFEINEGKQYDSITTAFVVNNQNLELGNDFYPLAFSANESVKGSASLSLREKGTPWFWDVKDVLEENKQNPHFDINDTIQKEAVRTAKRGGTALIVFNSSTSVDNIQFNKNDQSTVVGIPVIYLSTIAIQNFFKDATDIYSIQLSVKLSQKTRTAHNVVGYLNNHAATTVILGAHYDHLGYGEDGNSLDGQGKIHNGADDNASGTAALLELVNLLKNSKAKQNNYLFLSFSGEELGLFGSKYWLDHPSIDITPDYMINMDMVGRYDSSKKLTIGGYGTSPSWATIFNSTIDKNLIIHFDSSGSGPSDHSSFYRKDIPVLFFFTNSHSDYHKATDDWDKINYEGELEIVKYVQQIIEAADNKGKLVFTKTSETESRSIALPVTLGIMPDYGYSGTGLRIDGVSKGKLAERLGLQAGDILLQLGDYKFVDVQTYMQTLQHFKKGDHTTLRIIRSETEKVFDLTF